MLDSLLPYYEDELTALRKQAREFAERYPKIAGRLMLDGDACEDPHAERLLESLAFLTARIHKKLDDDFPQVTEALLSVLYPHFLRPVPSMSIAQLALAPGVDIGGAQRVERGAIMLTRPVQGMPVRYRSAWPVDVWPVAVTQASFRSIERAGFAPAAGPYDSKSVAVVTLRVQAAGQTPLGQLGLDRLRFYLDGESPLVHAMHELLLNSAQRVVITAAAEEPAATAQVLGPECLQAVGFDPDQGLLDYDPRSFLGYRLIQEYFCLPEKFLFVDLASLDLGRYARAIDIRIELRAFERPDRLPRLEQTVDANMFRLHCTPIVNLFSQPAEPIRLSHEVHEYPVIADVRRPLGLEIYSIDSVRKHTREASRERITEYLPFYSIRHGATANAGAQAGDAWWIARRVASGRADDDGTDLRIALVDRDMNPHVPAVDTLSISVTCTNRDLPAQLPFGGENNALQLEDGGVVGSARLLRKPSSTWRAPMQMANQWRLISHLALNHFSIVEGGREALLEILELYNFADSTALRRQISGIVEVTSAPSSLRIGQAPRRSWVRGTDITLVFDEDMYVGSGVYLLSRVLDLFFGLYCTTNAWTRLTVRTRQREEALVVFPPRAGALPLV